MYWITEQQQTMHLKPSAVQDNYLILSTVNQFIYNQLSKM